MKKRLFLFLVFFLILSATLSYADSMRCQGKMVSTGDISTKVLLTCGEPLSKELVEIKKTKSSDSSTKDSKTEESKVFVEKWTYGFGKGRLLKILTFQEGVLKKIETGDRM